MNLPVDRDRRHFRLRSCERSAIAAPAPAADLLFDNLRWFQIVSFGQSFPVRRNRGLRFDLGYALNYWRCRVVARACIALAAVDFYSAIS